MSLSILRPTNNRLDQSRCSSHRSSSKSMLDILKQRNTCMDINKESLECILKRLMLEISYHRYHTRAMRYFSQREIVEIIHRAADLIMREPMLIEIDVIPRNLFVIGSLNGNLQYLVEIFNKNNFPPSSYYIFLGDYTRGGRRQQDLEVMLLLLTLKLRFPKHIFLLRGHRETFEFCERIGFKHIAVDDNHRFHEKIYSAFLMLFDLMPVAAIVNNQYLCVHSGVSQYMTCRRSISTIKRPTSLNLMTLSHAVLLTDILYGHPDPSLRRPFAPSNKLPLGFRFNNRGLCEVLQLLGVMRMIRSCGEFPEGFRDEFGNGKCQSFCSGTGNPANEGWLLGLEPFGILNVPILSDTDTITLMSGFRNIVRSAYEKLVDESFQYPYEFDVRMTWSCVMCRARIRWSDLPTLVFHRDLARYVKRLTPDDCYDKDVGRLHIRYRRARRFPELYHLNSTENQRLRAIKYMIPVDYRPKSHTSLSKSLRELPGQFFRYTIPERIEKDPEIDVIGVRSQIFPGDSMSDVDIGVTELRRMTPLNLRERDEREPQQITTFNYRLRRPSVSTKHYSNYQWPGTFSTLRGQVMSGHRNVMRSLARARMKMRDAVRVLRPIKGIDRWPGEREENATILDRQYF